MGCRATTAYVVPPGGNSVVTAAASLNEQGQTSESPRWPTSLNSKRQAYRASVLPLMRLAHLDARHEDVLRRHEGELGHDSRAHHSGPDVHAVRDVGQEGDDHVRRQKALRKVHLAFWLAFRGWGRGKEAAGSSEVCTIVGKVVDMVRGQPCRNKAGKATVTGIGNGVMALTGKAVRACC